MNVATTLRELSIEIRLLPNKSDTSPTGDTAKSHSSKFRIWRGDGAAITPGNELLRAILATEEFIENEANVLRARGGRRGTISRPSGI